MTQLLVLPGDGIGPEIVDAAGGVLTYVDEKFGLGLTLRHEDVGLAALKKHGSTLPEHVIDTARAADGVILGPVDHQAYPPRSQGGANPSGDLRILLDLYANIRPSQSISGLSILREPMDLVIVRENTEGAYADRNMFDGTAEFLAEPDVALAVGKVSARASRRIAVRAFELARTRRGKVTAIHKANVLKRSSGLFLETVRQVAADYPDVQLDDLIVDAAAAHLVRSPGRFDVIVTTNMFGDILSDEAAELAGSLGLAASLNAGDEHAMAQAAHGSAPDIAGLGIANPTSMIGSVAMLLRWLAERPIPADETDKSINKKRENFVAAADFIDNSLRETLADPSTRTRDVGGSLSTREFVDVLLR